MPVVSTSANLPGMATATATLLTFGNATAAVAASASALTAGVVLYHAHLSRRRKGEPPVRWSWLPVLGYALEMGNRPLELLSECADKFGEIFGMVVAGNRMFIISDPHSYHLVFTKNKDLSWEEFHRSVSVNFFGCRWVGSEIAVGDIKR